MGRNDDFDDFDDDFLDPDSDAFDYKPVTSSEGGLGKSAKIIVAASVIGATAIGTWLFLGTGPSDDQNIPVVRAENQDFKQKPDDPGGMDVPNRDKTVYNRLTPENTEPRLERLLPRAEQPIAISEAQETEERGLPVVSGVIPEIKEPAKPLEPAPMVAEIDEAVPTAQENAEPIADVPSEELVEQLEPPKPTSLVAETAQAQSEDENAPRPLLTRTEQKDQGIDPTGPTIQDQDELVAKIAEALADENTPPAPTSSSPTQVAKAKPQTVTTPTTTTGPGFVLQVLSSKSESGVQRSLKQIQSQHNDLIGNIPANIVRADLGPEKGIYYRLRLGPVSGGDQAKNLCNQLKERKVGCFIVKVQ